MERKFQNRNEEQTVNAEGLGVVKFWREDQQDGTQRLVIGRDDLLGNVFVGISFANIEQDKTLVEQTKKAEHLNAYKIFSEQNGLEVERLSDAQAVEALARFSINWEQLTAKIFRHLEGYELGSHWLDIQV